MIVYPNSFLLLVGGASIASISSQAFVMQPQIISSRRNNFASSALKAVDDELEDLDKARAKFEFLMQTEGLLKDDSILPLPHTQDEYTPRPLTESSRRRRELEMELLASLKESDEAIDELMALWLLERGNDAAEALRGMETLCSPGLVEEERILRELLDEYGIHWAEPVSRLASLLYYKGNSVESVQWSEIALSVKPWHFEVCHTMVLNALRDNDLAKAVRWRRKALPPLNPSSNNKARKAWVERALKDAKESLSKAEAAAAERKRGNAPVRENEVWQ